MQKDGLAIPEAVIGNPDPQKIKELWIPATFFPREDGGGNDDKTYQRFILQMARMIRIVLVPALLEMTGIDFVPDHLSIREHADSGVGVQSVDLSLFALAGQSSPAMVV